MKKVILTLLAAVVVIVVLAGTGFAGYRMGYRQGAQASASGSPQAAGRPEDFGRGEMPRHNFGNDFERGFGRGPGPRGFGMMHRGMGFGFFSPFMFIGQVAVLALMAGFIYWLFTRSGWRLTRQGTDTPTPNTENK